MLIIELLETYKIDEESLIEDLRGELLYLKKFPINTVQNNMIKIIQDYKSDSKNNGHISTGSIFMAFSNPKTIKHMIIENKADYLMECTDISPLRGFFMNRARGVCIFYELLFNLSTTENGAFIRQIRELNKYMVNLHDQEINVSNLSDIDNLKMWWWDSAYHNFINKRKIAYKELLNICIAFYSSGYEYIPPYVILFIIDMYPNNYFLNIGDVSYFTLARYEKINLIESVRNYVVKLRNPQSFQN
jgi:hypothetical protein